MNSTPHFSVFAAYLRLRSEQLAQTKRGFPEQYVSLLVLFAVSPCPLALIKHLEHERRQITASDTGVLATFLSLSRPPGYITCVPQNWLWHGSCHWWGPWGPGCYTKQGGLLSLMACPLQHRAMNLAWVRTQYSWPRTQLPLDFAITSWEQACPP